MWRYVVPGIVMVLVTVAGAGVLGGPWTGTTEQDPGYLDRFDLDEGSLPASGCDTYPEVYVLQNWSGMDYLDTDPRPFHVRTNRFGLREQLTPETVRRNTTRILVLGDSFTHGTGVNVSDRFTDRTEVMLRERLDGPVTVINAGVPGAGIQDYCAVLEHVGLRYEPDMVVVAMTYYDAIPRRDADDLYRTARREVAGETDGDLTEEQEAVAERTTEMKTELYQQMTLDRDAPVPRYMERIDRMAEARGIPTIFYLFRSLHQWDARSNRDVLPSTFFQEFAADGDLDLVRAPDRFRTRPESDYLLSDGHYDETGHRWLAERLADVLVRRLADGRT